FHAVSTDFVSLAGDLEDITVEQSVETEAEENQVVEEEEIQTEEVVEDEIADDEDATSEKINTETDKVEKESVTEPEAVMPEAEITETKEESDQDEEVEFSQDKEVGGVSISLSANPGVLPEGAYFEAKEISSADKLSKMEESIEAQLVDSKKVADILAFDITIYDRNGNEIQPDTSKGNVKVSFKNSELGESISDSMTDVEVFHVADSMASAEAVSSSAGGDEVEFEAEHFSTYAVVDITDEENPTNAGNLDYTVEITVDGKVVDSSKLVEISKAKKFNAEFKFDNLAINMDEGSLKQNNTYRIAEIDISNINIESSTADIIDSRTNNKIGTITIAPNSDNTKAEVRITINTNEGGKATGSFDLSFDLNPSNENAEQSIVLPDGKTYTFEISEYKKEPPTISLSGSKKDDKTASWTATIKNSSKPESYEGGFKYVAELSKDETIDKNSVKVDGETPKPNSVKVEGSKLIVEFDSPNYTVDGTTTITYDTTVSFGLTQDIVKNNTKKIGSKITETPKLVDSNDKDIATGTAANVSFETEVNDWVKKESVGTISTDGVIAWKITVNNNGYDIKNVVLYDVFGGDGCTMALDGNVKVNGNDVSVTNGTASDKYSWKVDLGSPKSDGQWIITYQSKIADYKTGYLKKNHTSNPQNDAWITYDYDFGNGKGPFKGPTVKAESKINLKAGIQITGKNYDPATHELLWEVAVNQEYQDITGVKVTDIIPSNQEYVVGSISAIDIYAEGGTKESTITASDVNLRQEGNNVVLDFGDKLQNKKAVFQVKTKLVDGQRDAWTTNNTGKSFSNNIELVAAENTDPQTDTASITYTSDVLKVAISNYNYNNHTVDCEITVDSNKMDMSDVVLTDKLKYDGYELEVQDSTGVTVNGTKVSTTNDADGNLVVNLGDITAGEDALKKVKFTAKVISDKYQKVNNSSFVINDTATLVSEDILQTTDKKVEVTSNNIEISNSVLSKTGKGDKATGTVSYTVYINKARNQLPEGFTVRDTIGSSLELDSLSVKLYECTIADSNGQVTGESLIDESSYTKKVSNSGAKTVLDVTLPQTDKVYKLTYNASVVDTKLNDCSNSIEIVTVGYASTSAKVDVKSQFNVGAEFTSALYLTVTAKNKAGDPLSGVEYSVIDPDTNAEVLHLKTKDNGTAKAVTVKLQAGKKYTIKEVVGPDGYESASDKETQEFVAGKSNEQIIPFEYEKLSTTIDIYSRENSEDGELLAGSKMKLVKDGAETTTWNSKDTNPKKVKVYLDSEYVLSEEAPTGYNPGSNIKFKVVKDADGKPMVEVVSGAESIPADSINMVSTAKNRAVVNFSKVSAGQGIELIGAKLTIKDTSSNEEVANWKSDGTEHKVALLAGDYTLTEESAPAGYTKAEAIDFRIDNELNLLIKDDSGNYVQADEAKLTMVDDYDESTMATVTFSPTILGIDPSIFSSMKFAVFRRDSLSNKLVKLYPFDFDEDNQESEYKLNYQDEYVIMPEGEIEGYDSVEPITFKVIGEDDGSGNITTSMKMKTPGDTFKEASLTDIGKKATPKPTPEPVVEPEIPSNETPSPKNADPLVPSTAGDDNKVDEPKNAEVADNVSKKNSSSDDNDSSDSSSSSHSYAAAKATNPVDALT
ncbi:MAG: hypothetical protein K5883_03745, partial [Pseudobutyrivibrio sp.]|nr:hypothetical protein [Pseudobutyrivibrio sp.]